MGLEIERKFLLKNDSWRANVKAVVEIKQGYLNSCVDRAVRVRVTGDKGILTIKGKTVNLTREEFEYEIPLDEASRLIHLCEKPIIEKTRYLVDHEGMTWEVDVFLGVNEGLVVAEVEIEHEAQTLQIPDWAGEEVSDDSRYYNASLIAHPFSSWSRQDS